MLKKGKTGNHMYNGQQNRKTDLKHGQNRKSRCALEKGGLF